MASAGKDGILRIWRTLEAEGFFMLSVPRNLSIVDHSNFFEQLPYCVYQCHKDSILDLCWSNVQRQRNYLKNLMLLVSK
jgi:hypothetical protein